MHSLLVFTTILYILAFMQKYHREKKKKFQWRKFRWAWLRTVLSTIALQAPLDRARGELPSDNRTLTVRGKVVKFGGPKSLL